VTRLLTIMGSGETAPTMVKAHRMVVERLGSPPVRGLLLDTPFGFQTNAAELSSRAVTYFRQSVGVELAVAGMHSSADLQGPSGDQVLAKLSSASLVFAGPGSPTYALRQWRDTLVPALLAEKLSHGGAITFASAAALTLGVATVPVYEIYKVGEQPRWEPGLDLLTPLGLKVAVIPHYDNAEGGTHDTRYAYLGEERLALLEHSLPEGAFVLGIDEHTALFLDFETGTASVFGRGGVTVRVAGRSACLGSGENAAISQLPSLAEDLRGRAAPSAVGGRASKNSLSTASVQQGPRLVTEASPLLEAIRHYEELFRRAKQAADAPGMVAAALSLEEELWQWRADTLQSDEADRGRAALRAMVADLGTVAELGTRDEAELVGPFVEVALQERETARSQGRFEDADQVRRRLETLGVEVRDTPQGAQWVLDPRARPG